MTQSSFTDSLFRLPAEDPRVDQLLAFLAGRGWITAQDIINASKAYPSPLGGHITDRLLRATASASSGRILSGQHGYKLTRQATPDEMLASTTWLDNQAREMSDRARQIRKVWHNHQPDHRPAA